MSLHFLDIHFLQDSSLDWCRGPHKYPLNTKQPHGSSSIKAQPISSKSLKNIVWFFFNLLPICETFVLRINKLKEICPKGSLSSPSPSLNYSQPVESSRKLEKLLKTL